MPDTLVGHHCHLIQDIRNAAGEHCSRSESLLIVRKQDTLGRLMYLVQQVNGTSYYLFPSEFEITD